MAEIFTLLPFWRGVQLTWFHLILIASLQGVTEFLPISSSGHLALIPLLTGLRDQGLSVDVAAHAGTLAAVILYFRHDMKRAVWGFAELARGTTATANAQLSLCLVVATVPVIIAGGFIQLVGLTHWLRDLQVIGLATLGFGLLLYWADRTGKQTKTMSDWNVRTAVIFGLWQAAALVPGASRSGVTMTAARFCGFDRRHAARLAMLMSIPVIAAASLLTLAEILHSGDGIALREAGIAAALSFLSALVALAAMMKMLETFTYTPFVIYRVILGIGVLALAWSGG